MNVICGMNHMGVYDDVETDYFFFSKQGSIWGFATWKRTYDMYNDFDYKNDKYIMKLLKKQTKNNKIFWKRIKNYANNKYYEGHIAASEFFRIRCVWTKSNYR